MCWLHCSASFRFFLDIHGEGTMDILSSLKYHWFTCFSHTGFGLFYDNITATSVDRLLALLMGLRYRQTVPRSYAFVTLIWVLTTVGSVIYFHNYQLTLWVGHSIISTCLVTSVFSYNVIGRAILLSTQIQFMT